MLPRGASLANLGERTLKGIERPERVYGLLHQELGLDWELARPPNNLPRALSPFIGRSRELDELNQVLDQARLVTLVGPGGAGKTRLALRAVASDRSPSGRHLVGGVGAACRGLAARMSRSAWNFGDGPGVNLRRLRA
jgi:hypothetical protein